MRLQQQPRGDGGTPPQRPWWHIAGAAGAAAAAAGWAAWSYNDSQNSLNAAFSDPTYLASASPRAQAAVAASCAAPLLHLQHGLNPTPQQLSGLASALEADAAALGPELATGLWGLAMLGAVVPQQQLARLAEVVAEQMPQMPVYEAILSGKGGIDGMLIKLHRQVEQLLLDHPLAAVTESVAAALHLTRMHGSSPCV